jgi:hypothetical protein
MTKRVFSISFALVLLLSFTSVLPVYATGTTSITATASTPDVNGEFDVTVTISGNPGIAFFTLRLHFDKTKVEPVSVTRGSALLVESVASNVSVANIDFVTAVWSDADGSAANGTLYTVRFKVRDGATGKAAFGLTEHGIFDNTNDMDPVSVTLSGDELDFGTPATPAISTSVSTPGANREFDVTVSIVNNPGIAYFSLRLHFDKTKVEPISVTRGGALPVGSITSNVNVANIDFVTAVWSDADGSGVNGTLYTVRFRARDGATGNTQFSLTAHGIFDSSNDTNPVSAVLSGANEPVSKGVNVTVRIRSYNPMATATIQLMQGGTIAPNNTLVGGTPIYSETIPALGSGTAQVTQVFTIEGVAAGTYTLVVTKDAHTSFTITGVVVGEEDLDLTKHTRAEISTMTLRSGDLDNSNNINQDDLAILINSANYGRGVSSATNPLADLDGSGNINQDDLAILINSVNYGRGAVVLTYTTE